MSVEDTLEAIKKQLNDHAKRITKLEALPVAKEGSLSKKISVKEYINSKKLHTAIDKTLVIGYYLENFEGYSSFSVKDIEDYFRQAKEPVPSNINDMISKNVNKQFMMEAKGKKDGKRSWVLTNPGEQRMEGGFEKKS